MRYSDNIACKKCERPMRGKGVERDAQGREYIACEYCAARHEVVRVQKRPGGRVEYQSGELLPTAG
jgi:hypothetical protein